VVDKPYPMGRGDQFGKIGNISGYDKYKLQDHLSMSPQRAKKSRKHFPSTRNQLFTKLVFIDFL